MDKVHFAPKTPKEDSISCKYQRNWFQPLLQSGVNGLGVRGMSKTPGLADNCAGWRQASRTSNTKRLVFRRTFRGSTSFGVPEPPLLVRVLSGNQEDRPQPLSGSGLRGRGLRVAPCETSDIFPDLVGCPPGATPYSKYCFQSYVPQTIWFSFHGRFLRQGSTRCPKRGWSCGVGFGCMSCMTRALLSPCFFLGSPRNRLPISICFSSRKIFPNPSNQI